MKTHIGVDADSGLMYTVRGTSGHVSDVTEDNTLLHGQESIAFGDAGYQGIEERPDANSNVNWPIAMRPGKRKALDKENAADALIDQAEKSQGRHSGQSGAPGSSHQAPVWIHRGALQRLAA